MRISTNNFYISFQSQKKNQPVYAVDAHKNVQKFETRKEASVTLGVNHSSISSVLQGQCNRAGVYTFFSPEEIERIDDEGNVKIDDKKVEEAKNKIIKAVYAIDKDKNYLRFETQKDASLALGIAHGNISRCVNSDAGKCRGYVFVPSQEVEKIDDNGNVVLDVEKIEKLANTLIEDESIYVLDQKGCFQRFNTVDEVVASTGVKSSDLTKGFTGFKKVIGKNTYVKAKNIETKKVDGNFVLDENKLIDLFIGNRFSLYAIDKKGNPMFFKTLTECSRTLGVSVSSISNCINGTIDNIDGYTFVKPNQVLGISGQNQITLNKEKIKTVLADRFRK